jgi:hypothetical protein
MQPRPEVLCVVEGHREHKAVPELVRRIGYVLQPPVYPIVRRPFRVPRSRLANKSDQLERVLQRGGLRPNTPGGVLVVLDADDDCPVELGQRLSGWALMPDENYKPTVHQGSFAALMDIDLAAERSRSFRKFVAEVTRLLSAP